MQKSGYVLKSRKIWIEPSDETKLWDADWLIFLRDDGKPQIGTVTFAGERAFGAVPIHIELQEKYRNKGYGTEALKMMVEWAFLHKGVYEVKAVTEHENDKCVCALEKAGFVFREGDRHIEHYSIVKPKSSWMGLYALLGIFVGMMLAFVLTSPWVGMGIGMMVSLGIGASMDAKELKKREHALMGSRDE